MTQYKDYQLRVIDEKDVLEYKINKLRLFIDSEMYKNLENYDRILLNEQLFFMTRYCDVLKERIDRF